MRASACKFADDICKIYRGKAFSMSGISEALYQVAGITYQDTRFCLIEQRLLD